MFRNEIILLFLSEMFEKEKKLKWTFSMFSEKEHNKIITLQKYQNDLVVLSPLN